MVDTGAVVAGQADLKPHPSTTSGEHGLPAGHGGGRNLLPLLLAAAALCSILWGEAAFQAFCSIVDQQGRHRRRCDLRPLHRHIK